MLIVIDLDTHEELPLTTVYKDINCVVSTEDIEAIKVIEYRIFSVDLNKSTLSIEKNMIEVNNWYRIRFLLDDKEPERILTLNNSPMIVKFSEVQGNG